MIRAIRPQAMAQDDAALVTGWNISPNVAYTIQLNPGSSACGVLLYSESQTAIIASGAGLVGTDQPVILHPYSGQAIGMVDADLGWHLLLTTDGTEYPRTIKIGPAVDLPDEIHPIYADDDLAVIRVTAGVNAAAHYIDDLSVTCPLGLGAGLGDVASVPVDGSPVVGQVESITWTGTPDGAIESAVIRRHVAIAPEPHVDPVPITPPTVADDAAETDAETEASGNVLTNDETGLTIVAVNGLSANVAAAVAGDNGGVFTISSTGAWVFDPDGDFGLLTGSQTAETSVTYHASDGMAEAMATLTVTVRRAIAPIMLVGSSTGSSLLTNNFTINFPEVVRPGDLVVVVASSQTVSNVDSGVVTSGYTEICDVWSNHNRDTELSVNYKVMGSTPDTSVIVRGVANSSSCANAGIALIFRNVDQTTPLDVPATTAVGVASPNPNPPAITPITAGALVLITGGWAHNACSVPVCPAGFGNQVHCCLVRPGAAVAAIKSDWTSGAVDPAPWTGIAGDGFSAWCACTIALRPA